MSQGQQLFFWALNAISLQIFKNKMKKYAQVLPVHLAEDSQILKKRIIFICNRKCINGNNTLNEGVIGRHEMDCAKECLIEILNIIMEVTRAIGFMKPCVGLIFFVVDCHLILVISIYYHKSFLNALSILLENQIKIIMTKKAKLTNVNT